MLYKYCSNCYSLNVKYSSVEKISYCLSCNCKGEFKEDQIDKINRYRKEGNSVTQKDNFYESKENISENKDDFQNLDEKIKTKFGEKSKNSDWELL